MKCPECKSEHVRKNGMRRGKQNHICVSCDRQFVENPKNDRGYSDEIRKMCFKMYLNGMGFRGIERVTGVHHTTVINWVKQVGELLPDAYDPQTTPEVGELDELETFIGSKKTKFGSGLQ
jgi:transposase-like protein